MIETQAIGYDESPLVSVLMPSFNCADFVQLAIDSIKRQTWTSWELLIVDDGSDDETWAIVGREQDPRIRAWRTPNKGKAAALNFALARATGKFVALQDADDLSAPDRLEVALQTLIANPDLHGVLSGHWLLIGDRRIAPRAESKMPEQCRHEAAALQLPAHDPTLVVRRDVAVSLGFDESLKVACGLDFVLRLATTQRMAVIGEPLYIYRFRAGSTSRGDAEVRESYVQQVFNRSRAQTGLRAMTDRQFAEFRGARGLDSLNDAIGHFIDSAYLQVAAGNRAGALVTSIDAIRYVPFRMISMAPLVYAISPLFASNWVRRHRRRRREGRLLNE